MSLISRQSETVSQTATRARPQIYVLLVPAASASPTPPSVASSDNSLSLSSITASPPTTPQLALPAADNSADTSTSSTNQSAALPRGILLPVELFAR